MQSRKNLLLAYSSFIVLSTNCFIFANGACSNPSVIASVMLLYCRVKNGGSLSSTTLLHSCPLLLKASSRLNIASCAGSNWYKLSRKLNNLFFIVIIDCNIMLLEIIAEQFKIKIINIIFLNDFYF